MIKRHVFMEIHTIILTPGRPIDFAPIQVPGMLILQYTYVVPLMGETL